MLTNLLNHLYYSGEWKWKSDPKSVPGTGSPPKVNQFFRFVGPIIKFYSSFNRIFGKIGRVASEEVTLTLISAKCITCLLYAFEALPFNSSQLKSLGFPLQRILFKMHNTGSSDIVSQCQQFFNFADVSELISRRKRKFNDRFTIRKTYYVIL